jgi:hypothetical protein
MTTRFVRTVDDFEDEGAAGVPALVAAGSLKGFVLEERKGFVLEEQSAGGGGQPEARACWVCA